MPLLFYSGRYCTAVEPVQRMILEFAPGTSSQTTSSPAIAGN